LECIDHVNAAVSWILHSIHLAMVVKLINFSSSQLIVGFRCVCPGSIMPKLPRVSGKEVIKALEQAGFEVFD
ncbi:MAG: hypothetical protein AAB296_04190, partial [Candidatus Desantisbacteria bacterium]